MRAEIAEFSSFVHLIGIIQLSRCIGQRVAHIVCAAKPLVLESKCLIQGGIDHDETQ